jgi:dynein heavy chain
VADPFELTYSRPLSPQERIDSYVEPETFTTIFIEPQGLTERNHSHERYWHYINYGIPESILPSFDEQNAKLKHQFDILSEDLLKRAAVHDLYLDVEKDYKFSLKRSIVDYVLLDADERRRLDIDSVPKLFMDPKTIRAPVPWSQTYQNSKQFLESNLFITNPVMRELLQIGSTYKSLRIIDMSIFTNEAVVENNTAMLQADNVAKEANPTETPVINIEGEGQPEEPRVQKRIPVSLAEFQAIIKNQCQEFRNVILTSWLPEVVAMFITTKDKWYSIVSSSNDPDVGYQRLDLFFKAVYTLMSNQLWEILLESLKDFENYFEQFSSANSDVSLFQVNLSLSGSSIRFDPPFSEIEQVIVMTMETIANTVKDIPRVEMKLFTSLANEQLFLPVMTMEEPSMLECKHLRSIISKNSVAPQKHIINYDKFKGLLTQKAEKRIEDFVREQHSLEEYENEIKKLLKVKSEISSMNTTVRFSMVFLNCAKLSEDMTSKSVNLIDKLIDQIADMNRRQNSKYILSYVINLVSVNSLKRFQQRR